MQREPPRTRIAQVQVDAPLREPPCVGGSIYALHINYDNVTTAMLFSTKDKR
jgi:hypothetical protein